MRNRGATLQNYLVNGDPEGVILSYVSQWTGQAVRIPRNLVKDNLGLAEIRRPGIYFLIGADFDNPDRKLVYVGEANDIAERIKYHLRDDDKQCFETIVAFSSKDENMTVSHTKYLEKELIDLIARNSEYESKNAKLGNSIKLPRMVRDEMDAYLDRIKVVLPTLGYRFLDDHSSKFTPQHRDEHYTLRVGETEARARLTANGMIVLATSHFRDVDNDSLSHSYRNLRAMLLTRGIVVNGDEGSSYLFAEDYEFSSPSQAAAVVLGYSVNGRASWKDAAGRSLKEIEELSAAP